ncbi:hypothetical protein [Pseudoalteromonas sp. T1lg88]|uniref:hypothetical protein n=1 Tax=Pseudoalteromonas sp. T1lg88 TaxID=2077104 RepID=UPI000CF6591E|nr:hypothetical protein [Pseudoalteromonas sp. T1lg88]
MSKSTSEKVAEKINEFNNNYSNQTYKPMEPEKYNNILNGSINQIIYAAMELSYQRLTRGNYRNQQEFMSQNTDDFLKPHGQSGSLSNDKLDQVMNVYQVMYNHHFAITDTTKQINKQDWKEKGRFLLFRILTTIGVAGAAIGMAMLANSLGYETALIKKTSPEAVSAKAIDAKELTPNLTIKQQAKGKALEEVTSTNGNN